MAELDAEAEETSIIDNLDDIPDAVRRLQARFHPNYHAIVRLKLRFITRQDATDHCDVVISYCRHLLDVFAKISGGGGKEWRKVAAILTHAKLAELQARRKSGSISKEEYIAQLRACLKN